MPTKLLLLKDVEHLGRKGDVVVAKRGYAHNFLVPQGFALVANAHVLKCQVKLQEERRVVAAQDRKESEEIATRLQGQVLTFAVKVDHDGHMYGSVSLLDILELLKNSMGIELEKKVLALKHPFKQTGVFEVMIRLKEEISVPIHIKIIPEHEVELLREQGTEEPQE